MEEVARYNNTSTAFCLSDLQSIDSDYPKSAATGILGGPEGGGAERGRLYQCHGIREAQPLLLQCLTHKIAVSYPGAGPQHRRHNPIVIPDSRFTVPIRPDSSRGTSAAAPWARAPPSAIT